jgi:hypothetical protein
MALHSINSALEAHISALESMNSMRACIRLTDTFYRKKWATPPHAPGLLFCYRTHVSRRLSIY